jgi:hypothetical protein
MVDAFGFVTVDSSVPAFKTQTFNYVSNPSPVELGGSIVSQAFTASYNRAPTTATLSDTEGNTQDVTSTPTSFNSAFTITKSVLSTVTFTLSGDDGGLISQLTLPANFWPKLYLGLSVSPGPYTEAEIEALTGTLQGSADINTTLAPTAHYIVYAYPTTMGPIPPHYFTLGDLGPGDMGETQHLLNITNVNGVLQTYTVARSDNLLDASAEPGGLLAFKATDCV